LEKDLFVEIYRVTGQTPTKGTNMIVQFNRASFDVEVRVYPYYLLILTRVPTHENDLAQFEVMLTEMRKVIGLATKRVKKALTQLHHKGHSLNVGITPSTGEVGVVIEVSKGLTATECEKLTEMLKV
jgi:hypothetical protein